MIRSKIIFLLPDWSAGGMPVVADRLIRHFKSKYSIDLLLINDKEPQSKLPDDIKVQKGFKEAKTMFGKLPLFVRRVLWLKKQEKNLHADLIVSFGVLANTINVFANESKAVLTEHSVKSVENQRWGLSGILFQYLITKCYPRAIRVVGVSEGVVQDLEVNFDVENAVAIYNPSQDSKLKIVNDDESLPADVADFVQERNYFVYAGRLVDSKQIDLIVRGFARRKDRESLALIIIGEGDAREELEQLIMQLNEQDSIKLVGQRSDVSLLMKHATGTILYSQYEGFGNVLTESLFVGTKILVGDSIVGPREIVSNGEFVDYSVKVDEIEKFANGMLLPLRNGSEAEQLIATGIDQWSSFLVQSDPVDISRLSDEIVFEKYESVINQSLKVSREKLKK